MKNKMIGKCEWCNQDYCQECTEDVTEWQKFCCSLCEREYNENENKFQKKLNDIEKFEEESRKINIEVK